MMIMVKLIQIVIAILLAMSSVSSQQNGNINIGGFFSADKASASMRQVVFRNALAELNEAVLSSDAAREMAFTRYGRVRGGATVFDEQVELLESYSTVEAERKVCSVIGQVGLAAIFGSDSVSVSEHIHSICDDKAVPYVRTGMSQHSDRGHFSINMFPEPDTLSKSYADVVLENGWQRIALLYENDDALVRLQKVMQLSEVRKEIQLTILQLPSGGLYRHVLREVRELSIRHLVIDCHLQNIRAVLRQAQQIGMITSEYSIFFTSLDLHTLDLEDFKYSGCNITAMQMVDPSDSRVILTVAKWRQLERQRGNSLDISTSALTTQDALLFDGVALFGRAFVAMQNSVDVTVPVLSCADVDQIWMHGESLMNFMKLEKMTGLTGSVQFDSGGQRSTFRLNLIELREAGLVKTGEWSRGGLNITQHRVNVEHTADTTVIVTTILKDPYTMLKESSTQRVGNDRYEGICVDLIDELSRSLGFNYSFHTNPDDSPGSPDADGKWNGMIGELIDGHAHLAISDLTITRSRQEVVDFSLQWLSLGIGLLYYKPTPSAPSLFSFLEPLSLEVWIYIALAYLGVSVFMYVLARFSPYEWVNPHPCVDDPEEMENDVNMTNGLWFTIGSLMQQGSDIAPKAVSTRMVAGTWWFFTLIMVSSYTANLAAFLTIETLNSPISSAEDLARQTEIKYGLYEKGSTGSFFRQSTVYPFNKMWEFMEKQTPSVFESSGQGPDRVSKSAGKYAYFMESSTIEYVVERRCDLVQVGGLLDNKGYGIAVSKNSPVSARQLSEVILQMQENGKIEQLKTLWWKQKKDGGKCVEAKMRGVSPLALQNVGGVFVCLLCGVIMAVVQAGIEFVWSVREEAAKQNVSFAVIAMKELRFVFSFHGNSKPVPRYNDSIDSESLAGQGGAFDQEEPSAVSLSPGSNRTSSHYAASGVGYGTARA